VEATIITCGLRDMVVVSLFGRGNFVPLALVNRSGPLAHPSLVQGQLVWSEIHLQTACSVSCVHVQRHPSYQALYTPIHRHSIRSGSEPNFDGARSVLCIVVREIVGKGLVAAVGVDTTGSWEQVVDVADSVLAREEPLSTISARRNPLFLAFWGVGGPALRLATQCSGRDHVLSFDSVEP